MGTSTGGATPTSDTLTLSDGFKITYTSIGERSNPLLLLVVGSSGIGSLYRNLATELSRHFRCVYYDKRGFLPTASDPEWAAKQRNEVVSVEQQANDAADLIKHFSPSTPAYVFGTSCGATEVLDLTVRHTDLVYTAILHEPITFSVIRDERLRSEMRDLYRRVGKADDTINGHTVFRNYMFNPAQDGNTQITSVSPPPAPRNAVELFNSRGGQCEALAMIDYKVDEKRAKSVSDKIIIVVGNDSAHWQVSRPGVELAYRLGESNPVSALPGDHVSFASKSIATVFCKELLAVLRQSGRASLLDHPEGRAML